MKKNILILLLCSLSGFAQQPVITWQKTYGGTGSEGLFSTCQTADGGYITSGTGYSADGDMTENFGEGDGWLAKLETDGTIAWQKSYGGNGNDQAYKVLQTPDGGYVFAGYSESTEGAFTATHGGGDIWVVKTDAAGTIEWQQLLGGPYYDWANDIVLTTDGGFVIAGHSQSQPGEVLQQDIWLVKLDAQGGLLWQKTFGGSLNEFAYGIENTADGGFILTGSTESNDGDVTGFHYTEEALPTLDAWVLKLDSDGNLQWQKALGGYQDDMGYTIKQMAGGGYILAAQTASYSGDVTAAYGSYDYWIVKLDASGNIAWQKSLGGNGYDESHSITETADGYIVAGLSYSLSDDVTTNYGNGDAWLVKLNTEGQLVWEKNFGGTLTDYIYEIFTDEAGNFILTGYTYSNDQDVTGNHGNGDGWIINTTVNALSAPQNIAQKSYLYPNPASENIHITIPDTVAGYTITDASGKIVLQGTSVKDIDIKTLSSGIYTISTANGQSRKFIKR